MSMHQAGLVQVKAQCEHGKATQVELRNAPAFCRPCDMGVEVDVPLGVGKVTVDIAYGGMFYVIVDAASACAPRCRATRGCSQINDLFLHRPPRVPRLTPGCSGCSPGGSGARAAKRARDLQDRRRLLPPPRPPSRVLPAPFPRPRPCLLTSCRHRRRRLGEMIKVAAREQHPARR